MTWQRMMSCCRAPIEPHLVLECLQYSRATVQYSGCLTASLSSLPRCALGSLGVVGPHDGSRIKWNGRTYMQRLYDFGRKRSSLRWNIINLPQMIFTLFLVALDDRSVSIAGGNAPPCQCLAISVQFSPKQNNHLFQWHRHASPAQAHHQHRVKLHLKARAKLNHRNSCPQHPSAVRRVVKRLQTRLKAMNPRRKDGNLNHPAARRKSRTMNCISTSLARMHLHRIRHAILRHVSTR